MTTYDEARSPYLEEARNLALIRARQFDLEQVLLKKLGRRKFNKLKKRLADEREERRKKRQPLNPEHLEYLDCLESCSSNPQIGLLSRAPSLYLYLKNQTSKLKLALQKFAAQAKK